LQETKVIPGGDESETVTPNAGTPAVFPTRIVNTTIPPGATGFGRAVFDAESAASPVVGVGVAASVGVDVGVSVGVPVGATVAV
jgi:hypothetical protein